LHVHIDYPAAFEYTVMADVKNEFIQLAAHIVAACTEAYTFVSVKHDAAAFTMLPVTMFYPFEYCSGLAFFAA